MVGTNRRVIKNDEDIDNRSRAGTKGRRPGSREGTRDSTNRSSTRSKDEARITKTQAVRKSRNGTKEKTKEKSSRSSAKSNTETDPEQTDDIKVADVVESNEVETNEVETNEVATKEVKNKEVKTNSTKKARVSRAIKEPKLVATKSSKKSDSEKVVKKSSPKVVKTPKKQNIPQDTSENNTDNQIDEDTETTDVKSVDSDGVRTKFDIHSDRLTEIDNQIDALRRERRSVFRKMKNAHATDMKKVRKQKKKVSRRGGFVEKKNPVGGKLAVFLGVDEGTEFTAPGLTSKFWEAMRSKKLISDNDGRVFKVTKEVQDVFGVPASAKSATEFNDQEGFNFITYQRYLSDALKNNNGEFGNGENDNE